MMSFNGPPSHPAPVTRPEQLLHVAGAVADADNVVDDSSSKTIICHCHWHSLTHSHSHSRNQSRSQGQDQSETVRNRHFSQLRSPYDPSACITVGYMSH